MSVKENMKNVLKAASEYFEVSRKLYEELKLSDTPADIDTWSSLSKDIDTARNMIHSTEYYLRETQNKVLLQSQINFHFRNRNYVVRRKSFDLGTELTWEELSLSSSDGPWNAGNFSSLSICRSVRDRNNKIENSERKDVRGWIPGEYTWEIWTYNPTIDTWSVDSD